MSVWCSGAVWMRAPNRCSRRVACGWTWAAGLVTVDGREVSLTPTEYDLLVAFVRHPGKVLTHRHLLSEVWGAGYDVDSQLLRTNVSNLRHKIEPNPAHPSYLLTEVGVGYRLRVRE